MRNFLFAIQSRIALKPLALATMGLLFLGGCLSPTGYDVNYGITVTGGTIESSAADTGWWSKPLPAPIPGTKPWRLEDHTLATTWRLQNWQIPLELKNRTHESMRIIWPEARIHWENRDDQLYEMSQGEIPQETIVVAGEKKSFRVFPRSLLQRIAWGDPSSGQGHWVDRGSGTVFVRRMSEKTPEPERIEAARQAMGEEIFILLPIELGSRRESYVFRLAIIEANAYGSRY